MMKHTKGPWTLTNDFNYGYNCNTRNISSKETGESLGFLWDNGSEEYLANAKLIEAAPELLEALEWTITQLPEYGYEPKYEAIIDLLKRVKNEK